MKKKHNTLIKLALSDKVCLTPCAGDVMQRSKDPRPCVPAKKICMRVIKGEEGPGHPALASFQVEVQTWVANLRKLLWPLLPCPGDQASYQQAAARHLRALSSALPHPPGGKGMREDAPPLTLRHPQSPALPSQLTRTQVPWGNCFPFSFQPPLQ